MSEWDVDRAFWAKGRAFVVQHPRETLQLVIVKCYVMFVRISAATDSGRPPALARLGVTYMLLFRLFFYAAVGVAFSQLRRAAGEERRTVSVCFLVFVVCYGLPYVLGFAYERHVMPLVVVTLCYLAWVASRRIGAKSSPSR